MPPLRSQRHPLSLFFPHHVETILWWLDDSPRLLAFHHLRVECKRFVLRHGRVQPSPISPQMSPLFQKVFKNGSLGVTY